MTSPSGDGSGAQPLLIDTSKPHPARMYDYFLGGKDNYPVDRDAAEQFIKAAPEVREGVRANRRFMHRAVRHVVEEGGVRQIIDIGTGLPTEPNVHQIAHAIAPDTRIVYVDNDPIVSTHSMALMEDSDTSVILADLRDPRSILDHPEVREAIDFDRPVAVLLVAVVHFLSDEGDDPYGIVATLRDALPAGSYLVLSHATGDVHEDGRHDAASVYNRATATLNLRSHAQVLDFFGDFTLVDPGLVRVTHWRPEETPAPGAAPIGIYGGVARKNA